MPGRTRQFRLFVSSTFSDLKAERDALRQRVFPRLGQLCRMHDATFQAVDLRWGVSQEASEDQSTMRICMSEIDRCREATKRPNFMALLGERYGWRPLPEQIPDDEFVKIRGFLSRRADETGLQRLDQWYRVDENAVPPVYRLLPREGEYTDYARWSSAEAELTKILRGAVEGLVFKANQQRRYTASATEQEIAHRGLLDEGEAEGSVLCVFREIRGLPSDRRAAEYLDFTPKGDPDKEGKALQNQLKNQLSRKLGPSVQAFTTNWEEDGPSHGYLDAFCQAINDRLAGIIQQELSQSDEADSLDAELEAHREFAAERIRFFVGRSEPLRRIGDYLNKAARHPLVIYGEPGCGKSTLMAMALKRAQALPKHNLIVRFIGAAPGSANIRTLLQSLCRQLKLLNKDREAVPDDYESLAKEFHRQLARATKAQPLTVFLDALDQLSSLHDARALAWLPTRLPEHVHLVVSTLPGDCLEALERRVPKNQRYALSGMSEDEGDVLLDHWLKEAGRTLQASQRRKVLDAYATNGLPLFLRLAFEQARQWHSDTPPVELERDIPGVIRDLFVRLSAPNQHGALLVSRALSYLSAGKNGLSWDEVLAVLSEDRDVMKPLWSNPYFPIGEGEPLPEVLWSRLYYDLRPYLTERVADGVVTLDFYHRLLREAVEQEYFTGKERSARHQMLARLFGKEKLLAAKERSQWSPSARELSEWPYQLACGELWQELDELLMDFEFLQAKVTNVGPQALIEDFDLVVDTDRSARMAKACGSVEHLTRVRDAIRAASQVVSGDPTQLASQLSGRLLASSEAATQRLMGQVAQWSAHPWLRPLKASLIGGALRFTLRGHQGSVRSLAITDDGRLCATAGNSHPDQTVRIWDLDRGRALHVLDEQAEAGGYTPIAFTGDNEHLILGNGKELIVYAVATGLEVHRLSAHEATVRALAVATRAPRAVSADESGVLCVWDLHKWALEHRLPLDAAAQLLALSPEGERAAALQPSGLQVLDLESAEVLAQIDEDLGPLDNWWDRPPLAFSEDGGAVYFGHTLRCWKLPGGPMETLLRQSENFMEEHAVRSVLDIAPRANRVVVSPLEDNVRDAYFPGGTYDTLAVQDLATGETIVTLPPQGSNATAYALSADERRVVVAHQDHSVRVWDVGNSGETPVRDHDNPVSFARLVKDGHRAMTQDQGNVFHFWDLATGRQIDAEDEGYAELAEEASAMLENSAPEQDADAEQTSPAESMPLPPKLKDRRAWVHAPEAPVAVEFELPRGKSSEDVDSPDARPDHEIRIPMDVWELDDAGEPARCRYRAAKSPSPLNVVRVARDGKRAISAAWGSLRVWDLDTGRQRHRLEGHTGPVWNVVLADNDRKAVSVSEDATVRVWDLDNGSLIAVFTSESPLGAIEAATIRDNHKEVLTIVAGENSGRVHILRLEAG